MSPEDFKEWVRLHCKHTGGDAATAGILVANIGTINERWNATYAEMCECTQRLIQNGRVPQFPSEHPNALYRELRAMRAEEFREESTRRAILPDGKCDCPRCNGGEILPSYQNALDRLAAYLKKHGSLTGGIGIGGHS